MPPSIETERSEHVDRVRKELEELDLSGLLVTTLSNVCYLTGFTGTTAFTVVTPEEHFFFTDSRYLERVEDEISGCEVVDNTNTPTHESLNSLAERVELERLGFESEQVSVNDYRELEEKLDGIELVATEGVVRELRKRKGPAELEMIRESIRLNEAVLEELFQVCEAGMEERELAAEYEYRIRKRGARKSVFPPIVASAENSSQPHATFSEQPIQPGAPLTIDVGCWLNGYSSDMTRTVFVENCPQEWEEIYQLVGRAKDAVMEQARAGMTGKEVDAIARDIIEEAGYGDYFGHGLGHGLGVEVHEPPRFARTEDGEIPAGAVMSVEPGIYLPGEGGVRTEDLVVVREDGLENLNKMSDALTVVG